MAWDLAPSLKVLRDQVNKASPNRSKASDGTIGDAAHAKTASDHNPNAQDIVCAFDITHDPANGFDANEFAELQRKNPHPDLKYLVWNKRICSRKYGWTWRPSSGHTSHIHVSVGVGSDGKSAPGTYDNTSQWDIGEDEMSKITKRYIHRLSNLAKGEDASEGVLDRYDGGSFEAYIDALAESDARLVKLIRDGVYVKAEDVVDDGCQNKIDELYAKQVEATDKVFGKE